jgi:hypothetical protein
MSLSDLPVQAQTKKADGDQKTQNIAGYSSRGVLRLSIVVSLQGSTCQLISSAV